MTYTFKLSRRMARLRAPLGLATLLTIVGCNSTDAFTPDGDATAPAAESALASVTFAGGIPFGTTALPTSEFGGLYNGAMRNIWPEFLLNELAAIKSRGGKVVLMFAGSESNYKNADGTFSLSKWQARVDRFRGVDFSSYVADGTIVGHYLIDEPQDKTNWNGVPISPSTVDEMGRYSKAIWPGMATLVRTEPRFFPSAPRYVDAAWAQYAARFGDAGDYIRRQVADAQTRGLALVTGMNLLNGGLPNLTPMTASEIESWGSALLSSSYPCAFISWQYNATLLSNSGVKSAMTALRQKAQNRGTKSCRNTGNSTTPPPPPPPSPDPSPATAALPFGLLSTPLDAYSSRWTGTVSGASPATLVSRLDRAESAQMKLIVMLAGKAESKNADGTFSLTRWKAAVDRYRTLPLSGYVSRKSLYLHYLVDQPNCASCWGGTVIPWTTVEEMARYSKTIWPALPTTVKVAPSTLAGASFRWAYLDAGWAQYTTRRGDPRAYLAAEATAAQSEGLGLVAGLNVLNADGYATAPLTAGQIMAIGTVLAKHPSVCALMGLRYDATYLGQTGIRAALDSVAAVAKGRDAASCAVS
jgi:hypothetical protein